MHWLIDWWLYRLIDWLIDRCIDWLDYLSIDWLIDFSSLLIELLYTPRSKLSEFNDVIKSLRGSTRSFHENTPLSLCIWDNLGE